MTALDTMDALRQIVQSQIWVSPFRNLTSSSTKQRNMSLLKNQSNSNSNDKFDMKQESDDDYSDNDIDIDNDDEDDDDELDCIPLIDFDTQSAELYNILYSTIKAKNNTSVILYGRNGFGKSALLSSVIQKIKHKVGNNIFIYIYINGLLQTTDADALYEIVKQLHLQNGTPFNFNLYNNNNDNQNDNNDNNNQESELNNIKISKSGFVSNLEYLVSELRKITMDNINSFSRPIFIIMDHFEEFALRTTKQTLLYNLFDLIQSESALLNIIGITHKKDIDQFLEKRIKSRLSLHSKIYLPNQSFFSRNSFKLCYKIIYDSLRIHSFNINKNNKILIKKYNNWIDLQLFNNKIFEEYFIKLHNYGYSASKYLIISGILSSKIFTNKYYLNKLDNNDIKYIINCIDNELFANPFLRMIADLTKNELIILIVAAKLDNTKDKPFNFEIIYATLQYVMKQDSMMIKRSKNVYSKCYQKLINLGFLVKISNKSYKYSTNNMLSKIFHSNFEMVRLNRLIDSGRDILVFISKNIKDLPTWITAWLLNNKTHIFV